jgi:cytochrome c biogenesis protein CcmG/thiol:disulfide interchange protein DsbE
MNYPVVMGNGRVASDYGGITAIPTTFVIDRQGNIVAGYQGLTDQGTFESVITKLLKEPPGS